MSNPSAVGTAPRVSNARESIVYTSADDAVKHVIAERLGATNVRMTVGPSQYFWPAGGRIRVYMSGLPEDCHDLMVAIYERLETTDDAGYVLFPVKSIELDREDEMIRVIGDECRITQMRPMPS